MPYQNTHTHTKPTDSLGGTVILKKHEAPFGLIFSFIPNYSNLLVAQECPFTSVN